MFGLRCAVLSKMFVFAMFAGLSGIPDAHAQTNNGGNELVYREDFSGPDPDTMLGGAMNFAGDGKDWFTTVVNGKLLMENREHPRSLHFSDISWVRYPGSASLTSTDSSRMSVEIEAQNKGLGGAGILIGSGMRGYYLVFAIDGKGRYFVIKKADRKTRMLYSEVSNKIHSGRANEIGYEIRSKNISFVVNGSEVIKMPLGKIDRKLRGIGLAAFGLGVYSFDNVEISETD